MKGLVKKGAFLFSLSLLLLITVSASNHSASIIEKKLLRAYRLERNGWIIVHIEGAPYDRGFQHGYLLAPEIEKELARLKKIAKLHYKFDWSTYREAAEKVYLPRIPEEYRKEMAGIAAGARANGISLDLVDIVIINNFYQMSWYYLPSVSRKKTALLTKAEKCSAFIATGEATRDGKIVMAHNTWLLYPMGVDWNIILDIKPTKGHRMITQTCPGSIHSGPDWIVNDAGIMVTETTISGYTGGVDMNGIPESIRLRKATQYADSIDEWVAIMLEGNTGEYANDWLIGDAKTGEIARLELGLRHHKLWRTKSGAYYGCNIAMDPEFRKAETKYDYENKNLSGVARARRWEQLLKENWGKIDAELAKRFLADHFDTSLGQETPSGNTICGHHDLDPRLSDGKPFRPVGAVDGKVITTDMLLKWEMWAVWGHPCGISFKADQYLAKHPEENYLKPVMEDILAHPWTLIKIKR